MDLRVWLEKQAPDFLSTWQRFPLAIILAALNTALIIGKINEVVWLRDEVWARASLGLATGATLAVAGVYFAESRPEQRLWGILLKLVLPFAAIAAFQITDVIWFVPWGNLGFFYNAERRDVSFDNQVIPIGAIETGYERLSDLETGPVRVEVIP